MRPSINAIAISGILGLPVITGSHLYFPHPVLPNEDYHLIINPNFWSWSAGAFQLSAIVDQYYHTFTGDPTEYPVDFSLALLKPSSTRDYSILNVPFGVSTPANYIPLPVKDQPYWGDGDVP